jgi:hypothetical protein
VARPLGSSQYRNDDELLLHEMARLLVTGRAHDIGKAVEAVADKAKGSRTHAPRRLREKFEARASDLLAAAHTAVRAEKERAARLSQRGLEGAVASLQEGFDHMRQLEEIVRATSAKKS